MAKSVKFQVPGPVQALAGGPPANLGERKQRVVLAVLVPEANKAVPVSRLAGLRLMALEGLLKARLRLGQHMEIIDEPTGLTSLQVALLRGGPGLPAGRLRPARPSPAQLPGDIGDYAGRAGERLAAAMYRSRAVLTGVTAREGAARNSLRPLSESEALTLPADAHLIERHPGARLGLHDLLQRYASAKSKAEDSRRRQ